MPKSFCSEVFKEVQPLLQKILIQPFNCELGKGTLSKERFCGYMQQDSLYLIHFARALALAAGRATNEKWVETLLLSSRNTLLAERSLHCHYFREFDVDVQVEPNLACMAYTSYLLATVSLETLEEGVASLLPCFWIYREVGNHIASATVPANPYAKWIATYADQTFSEGVDRFVALTNEMADQASGHVRSLMKKAFMNSSYLEWYFWDHAYRMGNLAEID